MCSFVLAVFDFNQASHGYKVGPFVPTVSRGSPSPPCTPVLTVPNTVGLFRQ